MKAFLLRSIGLYVISSFCFASCLWAQEDSISEHLSSFKRENTLYTVTDESLSPKTHKGLLIIEDAHCNFAIQQKIVAMLSFFKQELEQKGYAPLVLQEGGTYGPIQTAVLRKNKAPDELQSFLDDKIELGEIGAAEYLHTLDNDFIFFGIEDPLLYAKNYEHFMAIAKTREEVIAFFEDAEEILTRLRSIIFDEELASFFNSMNTANLHDWHTEIEKLRLYALQYDISLKPFSALSTFFEASRALANLDSQDIAKELAAVNRQAKKELSLDSLHEAPNAISNYPTLNKYLRLKELLFSTDISLLIKDKEELEDTLFQKIAYTPEEKELVSALRTFSILEKVLTLTLTEDEYSYYKNELLQGKNLFQDLITYITSYVPSFSTPHASEDIVAHAISFYEAVHARDEVLARNIKQALDENESAIGIAIIGGFHTQGITHKLDAKNIAYCVLTPKVAVSSEEAGLETYYDVMQRFWQNYSITNSAVKTKE